MDARSTALRAAGVTSIEAWHARGINARRHHAALIDEALTALLARHRAGDIDASYAAYDEHRSI